MDDATLEMLRGSLTHVLTDGGATPLADRLDALGWEEVLADDAASAVRLLFEIKGATLSSDDAIGPFLSRTIADSTGRGALAAAHVVLPPSLAPPASAGRADGDRVVIDGIATTPPVGDALVSMGDGRLAVVPAGVAWSVRPLGGTDASLGWSRVSAGVTAADCEWLDADGAWTACIAAGRWALAAELVGVGHHVVAGAVEYTAQRQQYGRAIGTFQALQHRLAGAHASLVGAADVTVEAAATGSPWAAMVAKAVAGRAAEQACTQAQQSYGAIGFTWEHGLHRSIRRVYVLDWLLGSWRALERQIGAHLLETREVPRVGSL